MTTHPSVDKQQNEQMKFTFNLYLFKFTLHYKKFRNQWSANHIYKYAILLIRTIDYLMINEVEKYLNKMALVLETVRM